jgi:two-component system response regulator FixJ
MVAETQPIAYVLDPDPRTRDQVSAIATRAGLSSARFETASEFLAQYGHESTGCLILELKLPDMSGLRLQSRLVERGVDLPRIFLTSHANSRLAVEAMRGGAIDFLPKPVIDASLALKIQEAIARQQRERQREIQLAEWRQSFQRLTLREMQIFRCAVDGRPNKATARYLQISEASVETYRYRLMKKLNVTQLPDLIRIWVAIYGWQPPALEVSGKY